MSTVQDSILAVSQEFSIEDEVYLPTCALYSDEPPLETDLRLQQVILLLECLNCWWRDRTDFYTSANSTLCFSEKQLKTRGFRGSDFFAVLGGERCPAKVGSFGQTINCWFYHD